MTSRTPGTWAIVVSALASLALGPGCSSPPARTLRGTTPCPPGSGSIETWCDDAGDCELRVSTGEVFTCDLNAGSGCAEATTAAVMACQGVVGADGGGTDAGTTGVDATARGCVTTIPCVSSAQCIGAPGTSCNTTTNRCQTVLCGGVGSECSADEHCSSGLRCQSDSCGAPPVLEGCFDAEYVACVVDNAAFCAMSGAPIETCPPDPFAVCECYTATCDELGLLGAYYLYEGTPFIEGSCPGTYREL